MGRKRSSCKAIFVACLVIFNSLVIIPRKASGQTSTLDLKLAIDVQEKIREYKSAHELTASDGLFDLLKELLTPENGNGQNRDRNGKKAETARLVIQTTDATTDADIRAVQSFGGQIINPSVNSSKNA